MNRFITILLFFIFSFSQNLYAQDDNASAVDYDSSVNKGGLYFELGGKSGSGAFMAELGKFGFISEHLSSRAGLSILASESADDIFSGGDLGVRYNFFGQGFSPFVGLGLFAGWPPEEEAEHDAIDNDDDGYIDESGEKEEMKSPLVSVYPELGFHLWVKDSLRITISSKSHITTKGRSHDFKMYSLGFALQY